MEEHARFVNIFVLIFVWIINVYLLKLFCTATFPLCDTIVLSRSCHIRLTSIDASKWYWDGNSLYRKMTFPKCSAPVCSCIHWPTYVWAVDSVLWVIYSSSRWEWQSVLCYLFCIRLIRVSCIILTFHLITRYVCKLDMIVYSANYGVFTSPVYIRIASILFDVCEAAVQKVFISQKLWKK